MPDPLHNEAAAWMDRARDDLRAATKLMAGADPMSATAAYHCQQAAEKALKAFLASTGALVPKIHDLRRLGEVCAQFDPVFEDLRDACDELTPYATEYRYPTELPDPTSDDVVAAIALAKSILDTSNAALKRRFPMDHSD